MEPTAQQTELPIWSRTPAVHPTASHGADTSRRPVGSVDTQAMFLASLQREELEGSKMGIPQRS